MKIKRLCTGLLALGMSVSLVFQTPVMAEEAAPSAITTNAIAGWPQGSEITSTAAVVIEDSTDTLLYAKNMDQVLYPGAAVKVMTILMALENSNLTDNVTMTETGVAGVTDGGVNISAQVGEVFTMEQCMYAIMLASANDIALQVAEHIGGSVDAFVQMMNARAAELGCTNTVFTNPTGLPDENQHVTAHDMALIMEACIRNDDFRTIAAAASYTIPPTNMSGGERAMINNFAMMNSTSASYYQGCLGGKIGFTDASGSTLVCAAERNGSTLIAVVLQGVPNQIEAEAITILDYGFANFHKLSLGENDFNMISGGDVFVPVGTTADMLTFEDTPNGEEIHRQYYFGGAPVGTASMSPVKEQDDSAVIASEQHIEEARQFTENRSYIPYAGIAGICLLLFVLILLRIIKIIKE